MPTGFSPAAGGIAGGGGVARNRDFKELTPKEQVRELALLSKLVYGIPKLNTRLRSGDTVYLDSPQLLGKNPENYRESRWKVLDAGEERSGLKWAVVEYGRGVDHQVVTVFAGTDPPELSPTDLIDAAQDWAVNIAQGVGDIPSQYTEAGELAMKMKAAYPDVIFTGHSLGGGLAAFAGLLTDSKTVQFNPAPLGPSTQAFLDLLGDLTIDRRRNITRISTRYDPISVGVVKLSESLGPVALGLALTGDPDRAEGVGALMLNRHLSLRENEMMRDLPSTLATPTYSIAQHSMDNLFELIYDESPRGD